MSVFDVVNLSTLSYAFIYGVIPIIGLGISILKPRGLYYMSVLVGIYSFLCLTKLDFSLLLVYIIVYAGFILFWFIKGGQDYMRNGYQFDLYKEMYESYYADDLNDDGIIDAFDNWKIAHDPRFSWIFASRKVRRERNIMREYARFSQSTGYNPYFGERIRDYSRNPYGTGAGQRQNTSGQSSTQRQYYQPDRNLNKQEQMSEAERKVAAQHEFARRHNLRYFAMCNSKSEGKKLYHKYAAKYHPDNAITGDKEKFIKIDEEYNRFTEIPDSDFVA